MKELGIIIAVIFLILVMLFVTVGAINLWKNKGNLIQYVVSLFKKSQP